MWLALLALFTLPVPFVRLPSMQVAPSSAVTFLAYEMCFSALTKIVEDQQAAAAAAGREMAVVEAREPADIATD